MPCKVTVYIRICTQKQREGSLTRTNTSVKTQDTHVTVTQGVCKDEMSSTLIRN